jgi:tripartite-type tricarboxylate transporter receptor subunit TctC
VQLTIAPSASVMPHVKSGKLRALGVTSAQPSALFPDLPTVASSLPGYEASTFHTAFAPAGTPGSIIGRLNGGIARFL